MKWVGVFVILSCGVTFGPELRAEEKAKIAVMPLRPQRVAAETVEILDELLLTETHRLPNYKVIGASDINAILGLDKMKAALGCDDLTCAAEIGGALGVELLLAGSVSSLGGEVIVSLRLIDIAKQEVLSRGTGSAPDKEENYRGAVQSAVADMVAGAGLAKGPASSTGATASSMTQSSSDAAPESEYVSQQDWQRYLQYRQTTPNPLTVENWAAKQNEESIALFVMEIASPILGIGLWVLAVVSANAGNDWLPEAFGLPAIALVLTAIVLPFVDLADVGSVEIREAASPSAASLLPRDPAFEARGLNLSFSF